MAGTDQTSATMVVSANPAGNYGGFRGDTGAGDANFKCITKDAVTQNIQDTGVPLAINTVHTFRIEFLPGVVAFFIDGNQVCTSTTNIPASTIVLRRQEGLLALDAVNHDMNFQLRLSMRRGGFRW